MNAQWRLALSGAVVATVVSLCVAAIGAYYFGLAHSGAFLYGALVGLVTYSSIALTAWLLGGSFSGERMLLGMVIYIGRLIFAALAIGIPMFIGSWPALAMVSGFAMVYLVENLVLLIGAARTVGASGLHSREGTQRRMRA